MSYLLVLILNLPLISNAQNKCQDIFVDSVWAQTKKNIESLNLSEWLSDVILVQHSPLVSAIRKGSITDVFNVRAQMRDNGQQNIFFDQIGLAIALQENAIAKFLYHHDRFNYINTPFGKDLFLVAVYFNNIQMLKFFAREGIVLPPRTRNKVLAWALSTNRPDVHWAMTRLSR